MSEYKMAHSKSIAWRLGWADGFVWVFGPKAEEKYRTEKQPSWDCGYEAGKCDVCNREGKHNKQTRDMTGEPPPDWPSPCAIAWWLGWRAGHVEKNADHAKPIHYMKFYCIGFEKGRKAAKKVMQS